MLADSTAVTGLRAASFNVEIISNNLANSQTPGFKASQVRLQNNQDGGVQVGSTPRNNTQGSIQLTGFTSDLAIEGSGYFAIQTESGETLYTRGGGSTRDADGFLRHPSGGYLSSNGSRIQIPTNSGSYSIDRDGTLRTMDANGNSNVSGTISLSNFPNEDGLRSVGDGLFQASEASGVAVSATPGAGGSGTIFSGGLEMSNVDVTTELVNSIIAQRSFEANIKVVSTSDEMLKTLTHLGSHSEFGQSP